MPVREQSRMDFVVDITFDHPYKVMEPHNDADCGKRNRVYIYCGSEQYMYEMELQNEQWLKRWSRDTRLHFWKQFNACMQVQSV